MAFPYLFVRFLARRDPAEIARQYSRAVPAAWRSSFQCNDRGTIATCWLWQLSREGPILVDKASVLLRPLCPIGTKRMAESSQQDRGTARFPQLPPWRVCSKNSLCPGPKEQEYEPASLSILPALRTPARRSSPGRKIAPQLPILWLSPFSRPQSCRGRPDRSREPNPAGSAGSRTRLWPVGAARRLHGRRRTASCSPAARGG